MSQVSVRSIVLLDNESDCVFSVFAELLNEIEDPPAFLKELLDAVATNSDADVASSSTTA